MWRYFELYKIILNNPETYKAVSTIPQRKNTFDPGYEEQ